jgi:hypothetical protein
MCPLINSTALSTSISIANVNNPVMTTETTRCSRGNATLRTSEPFETMLPSDSPTDTFQNVQGSKPLIR